MSVEVAANISAGAPSAPSFPGEAGGSVFSGINSQSLFSETTPFVASATSVPEVSPKGIDLFSDSFVTLGKAESVPKANVLPEFNPVVAKAAPALEKPIKIDLNSGEWLTVATKPREAEIFNTRVSVKEDAAEQVTHEALAPERKIQAAGRLEQQDVVRIRLILEELAKENNQEDEEDPKKQKERKVEEINGMLIDFSVDKSAQANRKSMFRKIVGEVFKLARLKNDKKVLACGRESSIG